MFPQNKNTLNSRGFTLIELLVVISIIVVLAALAFPALRTAQAKANESKCLNNVRQWGTVVGLYAGDNDQQVAWDNVWSIGGKTPGVYLSYMSSTNNQLAMRVCPSEKSAAVQGSNPSPCYMFIRPTENGTPASSTTGTYRLSHISNPTQLLVMIGTITHNGTYIGANGTTLDAAVKPICVQTANQTIRHMGSVLALFADFHARPVQWSSELDTGTTAGKKNQATWTTIQ